MNIRKIQAALVAVSLGISALNAPYRLFADSAEVCSKEVLLAYFPENFVEETLKNFKVPQNNWDAIIKELNTKEKDIVKLVEEKASKLNPNPLKDNSPESRHETVKIFRETLLNIFSDVLKDNGVKDDKQIQSMLTDIQQQKAKNFAKCMEKQRAIFDKEKSSSNSSSFSNEPEQPKASSSVPGQPKAMLQPLKNNPDNLSDAADDDVDQSDKSDEDQSSDENQSSDQQDKMNEDK